MKRREIVVLTDISMITAVVQRGIADVIVQAAIEAGAQGATIYYGRGSGVRERLGVLGLAVEAEKEIVNVLIANDQVDQVFERIYVAGDLDTPGKGIVYVTALEKAATHIPDFMRDKLINE
jgi:nitrogen regulatory protein PII